MKQHKIFISHIANRQKIAALTCGTAYAMRYIRANIQGGIEIGFDVKTASLIAAQTVLGAAELLLKTGSHPEAEIDKVTTPPRLYYFSITNYECLITNYEFLIVGETDFTSHRPYCE